MSDDIATRHRVLQETIGSLSWAPSAVKESAKLTNDLSAEVKRLTFALRSLEARRIARSSRLDRQHGPLGRLRRSIGSTANSTASERDEQSDLANDLQEEADARQRLDELTQRLRHAEAVQAEQESSLRTFQQAQTDLDALHESQYPQPASTAQEIALNKVNASQAIQTRLTSEIETEEQVIALISRASASAARAMSHMRGVMRWYQASILVPSALGVWVAQDVGQKPGLIATSESVRDVRDLFKEAKHLQDQIQEVKTPELLGGSATVESVFWGADLEKQLGSIGGAVVIMHEAVLSELDRTKERKRGLRRQYNKEGAVLEERKAGLREIRCRELENQLSGLEHSSELISEKEAPPAYH